MTKIKISRGQENAIKLYLDHNGNDVDELIDWFGTNRKYRNVVNDEYKPMMELSHAELAKAMYIDYVVEETFCDGDKIVLKKETLEKFPDLKDLVYTLEVDSDEYLLFSRSYDLGMQGHEIELASTERIKAEEEFMIWESLDRKVGEFKIGDVVVYEDNQEINYTTIKTSVNINGANTMYIENDLIGFYPTNSFVPFVNFD